MYVCVCRGFNERQVQKAARDCRSVSEIFCALGGRPRCGKCIGAVRDIVVEVAEGMKGDLEAQAG